MKKKMCDKNYQFYTAENFLYKEESLIKKKFSGEKFLSVVREENAHKINTFKISVRKAREAIENSCDLKNFFFLGGL